MEALIGIFASPGEYGSRLAAYINSRRDIGYGGISFQNNSELAEFFRSGELSILLTEDPTHLKNFHNRTRVYFLCEDRLRAENDPSDNVVFKYSPASEMLRQILPATTGNIMKNNIYAVFSPSYIVLAGIYYYSVFADAKKKDSLIKDLQKQMGESAGIKG